MGRKEDNIKKAQALLHLKDRIRNIGTAAHIDHGKCVTFETRIWVNGRWIRAGDLWAQYANRPPVPNKFGADVRDVRSESLWTHSLDLSSGSTEFAQLTHAWRLRSTEPLVEVESRDGRRIRTTAEHPFIVADGVKLDYREARALRKGDVLVVPRRKIGHPRLARRQRAAAGRQDVPHDTGLSLPEDRNDFGAVPSTRRPSAT